MFEEEYVKDKIEEARDCYKQLRIMALENGDFNWEQRLFGAEQAMDDLLTSFGLDKDV